MRRWRLELGRYLAALTSLVFYCLHASEASCLTREVEVGDVCVWSPGFAASDLSDVFNQCRLQGGQPFTFASLGEMDTARTLLQMDHVEVFVPAIRNNGSYHWLSAANSTGGTGPGAQPTFFSGDVQGQDLTAKQCVTFLGVNFTVHDCSSQACFMCQRALNSTLPPATVTSPPGVCGSATVTPSMPLQMSLTAAATPGAIGGLAPGTGNSSSDCVTWNNGSCVPFDDLLLYNVLCSLKEGALDQLVNDTSICDWLSGRQSTPPSHHTPWTVINVLQGSGNRTSITTQLINDLDLSNLTHESAEDALHAVYDILVADNSTEEGMDDRVAALLFKMSHVPFIDEDMVTVFTKSVVLVIVGEERKPEKKDMKESQAVRVLESMERILENSNVTRITHHFTKLGMNVQEVNTTGLPGHVTINTEVDGKGSSLCLSKSLFPLSQGKLSTVVYSDIHQLLPSNRQGALKSGVVSSHVLSVLVDSRPQDCTDRGATSPWSHHPGGKDRHQTYLDFTVNFTLPYLNAGKPGMVENRWCVYWKFRMGTWSDDGCWVLEHNRTHTTCTCNHLSTYAVLVTFTRPAQMSAADRLGMFVLTVIGCSLSIGGLAVTLLTFIYLRIIRREMIFIHANLALSLMLAQALFIMSDYARKTEVACKAVAVLLHFLFLAALWWMLVEGVALYRICTRLLYPRDLRLKYCCLGWGVPFLIVVISLGLEFPNYGQGLQDSCWLSVDSGLIWAFVGPMLAIVLLNVFILCLVIRAFLTLRANSQKSDVARARAGLRAMVMLFPLLGTTWLLSLLVPVSPAFGYLFILCNSLHGLLIFLLHCLGNEEVRRFLARKRRASRSGTSESDISIVGWRRRPPVLTFDDVKPRPQAGTSSHTDGRRNAWV